MPSLKHHCFLTLLMTLIYSCKQETVSSDGLVIKVLDTRGVEGIENPTIARLVNDSVKHGKQELFFPDGSRKGEMNYHMDTLHGRLIKYHTNGQIQLEQKYYKGQLEGYSSIYYSNGALSKRELYNNDAEVGGEYGYKANGDLMYYAFNAVEATCYMREYDTKQVSYKVQGSPMTLLLVTSDAENLVVGDTLRYYLLATKPPDCNTTVKVEFRSPSSTRLVHDPIPSDSFWTGSLLLVDTGTHSIYRYLTEICLLDGDTTHQEDHYSFHVLQSPTESK